MLVLGKAHSLGRAAALTGSMRLEGNDAPASHAPLRGSPARAPCMGTLMVMSSNEAASLLSTAYQIL